MRRLQTRLDDFELKGTLGQGVNGEVRLCMERASGELFAIKSLHKAKLTTTEDVRARATLATHAFNLQRTLCLRQSRARVSRAAALCECSAAEWSDPIRPHSRLTLRRRPARTRSARCSPR